MRVKLLFLNPVGTVGGAERVLLDVMASLRAADPSLDIHLAAAADGPLIVAARALGAEVTVLPLAPAAGELGESGLGGGRLRKALALLGRGPGAAWAAWRYAGRLRRLVERLRPDVVHSNGIKFHLLTRLARLRPPVVWHLHDFLGRRALLAPALRWAARGAAGGVAISQAVERDARAVLGPFPTAVVLNAVDTERFAPGDGDGAWLDRLAGLSPLGPGAVRVGLVATYARWKGQDVFLGAARRVADELPSREVRFYVVGGPIYQTRGSQWSEEELRRLGSDLSAAGRLGFVGFRPDTPAVYRALDVVVHASTQPEPFGLTIAEAMACGRAVVVARAGGAAELFHDDEAVGVAPGDEAALARAVADLVSDPDRRRRLGDRARAAAVARFARGRLGPELLAAYRRFGVATGARTPLEV